MATQRAGAPDVGEAVGAVRRAASARALLACVRVAAADHAARRRHAAAAQQRRPQPTAAAAGPRAPGRVGGGEAAAAPGQGELAQQARQTATTAEQQGVEVDSSLRLALPVEVARHRHLPSASPSTSFPRLLPARRYARAPVHAVGGVA